MIVVIADDLSGAAELAGAAATRGFVAEVQTKFDAGGTADIIALDTNSRSMSAENAAAVLTGICGEILHAQPAWIFKKTDSVLRGNVLAEIESIVSAMKLRRALLIPANPGKGRIIRDGVYYINNSPLANTLFAADPEHPRRTSNVVELLCDPGSASAQHVKSVRTNEEIPEEGIIIPDVGSHEEIVRRTADVNASTLPAGGVEFFEQLLEMKFAGTANGALTPDNSTSICDVSSQVHRVLFVCGSAQAWQHGRQRQCDNHSIPVLLMPDEIYQRDRSNLETTAVNWVTAIVSALNTTGCAMAAIGRDFNQSKQTETSVALAALITALAAAVSGVLGQCPIHRVYVEGGATAAALVAKMGWSRLTALSSPGLPGVAVLRPLLAVPGTNIRGGPTILIKPGSYPWPDCVWPNQV